MANDILSNNQEVVEAINIISSIGDEMIGRVPEEYFVNRFLPMLMADNGRVDLTDWVKVAGHVFNEVEVIGKDGTVIHRVPSLFKRFKTKQHFDSSMSIKEILDNARNVTARSPRQGAAFLDANLKKAGPDEPIQDNALERWNKILKHYGYPPIEVKAKKGQQVSSSTTYIEEEYDDAE